MDETQTDCNRPLMPEVPSQAQRFDASQILELRLHKIRWRRHW